MLFYTVGQSRIFLTMLYAGMCIGLYAMLDSMARRLFEAGRLLTFFMDLIFGAVIAVIIIFALTISADGELRLYSLMGALCGYILFSATLGNLLPRVFALLFKPFSSLIRLLSQSRLLRRLLR